ncbi:serine-protein kinase RsbW [Pseudoruegeria aquimaris]|uniref:Serine-protein kinase RsbW n=1 Tax=Pseudoruegeria aquimaris TaxID=393663 RepID=A0A1Y5TRN6_9RHOB|nr:ATP-binding protein [Pseudoruegeria aquimaris]SLN68465.1 serine-protein kinase RsbW [Pseudoruegeria aquimaris]
MNDTLPQSTISLRIPGDAHSVRQALDRIDTALRAAAQDPAICDKAQIVLGEVMNNVVEHAYASRNGTIEVDIAPGGTSISFLVTDEGDPMPEGALPSGRAVEDGTALDALPEGGFGWLLIHQLAQGIEYRRVGSRNELRFRLDLAGAP